MESDPKEEKGSEDIHFKICNSVLKLELSKGHLKWRVSDISREADVTRSLIYYYFGKEKEVILEEAYKYMLEVMFSLNESGRGIEKRLIRALTDLQKMPYLLVVFYMEKDQDSHIGELIRKAERQLIEKIASEFPERSEEEILTIYLLELGMALYKTMDPEQVSAVLKKLA